MKRNKNSSKHLFTSRESSGQRLVVGIALFVLILFSLCSVYAIIMSPSNPAAYAMAGFFIMALIIFLGVEENQFPMLPRKKTPYAIISWFFTWIFLAFIASFILTLNASHFAMAILFGTIAVLSGGYVVSSEKQWTNLKTKTKDKTGGAIKRKLKSTKTGKKISKRMQKSKRKKQAKAKNRKYKYW